MYIIENKSNMQKYFKPFMISKALNNSTFRFLENVIYIFRNYYLSITLYHYCIWKFWEMFL